jgi:hypothetical protein
MNRTVWALVTVAFVSLGICIACPINDIHFGWIGTLVGSASGFIATLSSYRTEEKVQGRFGGDIYKFKSPIKFLLAHVSVGSLLVAFAVISVFGCMGLLGR